MTDDREYQAKTKAAIRIGSEFLGGCAVLSS